MTPSRRHLEALHTILLRHEAEIRVVLAEVRAALDAEPPRELAEMGERTTLRVSDFGFPIPPKGNP